MTCLMEPLEAYQKQYDENVIVLDVRKEKEYQQGHLEKAHLITRTMIQPNAPQLINQSTLETCLGHYGVQASSHLILTDGRAGYDACYLWFLLSLYGFQNVSVLNGGIDGLRYDQVPLTQQPPSPPMSRTLKLKPLNSTLLAAYQDILTKTKNTQLLDVRSLEEHLGYPPAYDGCRLGNIPNSHHMDYREALDERRGYKFKSIAELKTLFQAYLDQPVIVYCQVGIRSSLTLFVLSELLRHPHAKNYAGSWLDYHQQTS